MIPETFAKIINNKAFYIEAKELLAKLPLTKVEGNVLELINKFFGKYERMPKKDELLLFFDELPEQERKFIADYKGFVKDIYNGVPEVDEKVLLAELKERVNKQRIKERLVRIADNFENMRSEVLVKDIQQILFENIDANRGTRVEVNVEDVEKNLRMVKYKESERIPTMLSSLDSLLYGGLGIREFACMVAPSGRGKTTALINMMYGFMLQGYSVLYITLEMSAVDILRRLYRRIMFKGKDFLIDEHDAEMKKWLNKYFQMGKGRGKVVYFPANSFSAEDLKAEMVKMEVIGDFYPQVIIIDHLDLMTSHTKSIRQKEVYSYWRLIVDDLREIPLVRNIPILTATQGTRKSSEKVLVTEVDVGESYGKVQSSDIVLSINQTPEELANNRMRLSVIKNRDYLKGVEIELYVNFDWMMMTDLKTAQTNGWL